MKFSIAASLLILAIAASFVWHDHQRLVIVREKHIELTAEAERLGISIDPENPSKGPRITKHQRADREADARLAAIEFIAFAKEMEATQKKGEQPDEAMQERILTFMDRMMSLDSSQIKILIAEVRAATDLKDETRQGLIGFSIMTLASDHPQAALALFTESSDLMEEGFMGQHVISSSLSKWASDDPVAALAWVRENSKKFPDLITDDAKRGLITGAANQDLKLAFSLIGELDFKESNHGVSNIMRSARTPEERSAALAAFREYRDTLPDEKTRTEIERQAIGNLAQGIAKEGFETAQEWLTENQLSATELEAFASHLTYNTKSEETGQWLEWMGESLPAEKSATPIKNTVRQWTDQDFKAAGEWLASAPAGPGKNSAVQSYAETIARYEPEVAAQWALTLPPGDECQSTLRSIYHNWPKDDETAKNAFAEKHGFK
jgi:hypothetical protein